MLDSKGTFDDLVRRYAGSPEQAEGSWPTGSTGT
jgi:hypothetical protein